MVKPISNQIPDNLTREDIQYAINALDRGVQHGFGPSTGYDLLYKGKRYAPKAVLGLAVSRRTSRQLGPYDFKGGLGSKCFRILEGNGFVIVPKDDNSHFLEEIEPSFREGAGKTIFVNRFERDIKARDACISHYGTSCQVCGIDFQEIYGDIGKGFINVHHLMPLASIGKEYDVDPLADLIPVCPNCHAMLHTSTPPLGIDEFRQLIIRNTDHKKNHGA